VTKADLSDVAMRARRDLAAALRSLGARDTPVVSVSSVPPPGGIDELIDALDAHRSKVDVKASRLSARRLAALAEYATERGESGLRTLGGRREALRLLEGQDPGLEVPALVEVLERAAG